MPVKKCITLLHKHLLKHQPTLPLPIDTIIKICTLCTDLNYFQFNGQVYKQKSGLPMGSPLSPFLACFFLEFLESKPFKHIIPKDAEYFRYIDDILLIFNKNVDLQKLVDRLNKKEPSIKFTYEVEENGTLPFLDILLHNKGDHLLYSVFRKKTHKNDLIHFYSHHHNKIKSGLVIGSYLRAFRICSPQFLQDELTYIHNTYKSLQYPHYFIQRAKNKAFQIHNKNKATNTLPLPSFPNRPIILPNNQTSASLQEIQSKIGLRIVNTTSRTIRQILHRPAKSISPSESGIYEVPCSSCSKCYVGETSRSLSKRLYEHQRAIILSDLRNALVQHQEEFGHDPDFEKAKLLMTIHGKRSRQLYEAAFIMNKRVVKQRPGRFRLAKNLSTIIINNSVKRKKNK